jgi:magnesium chelatase family protein
MLAKVHSYILVGIDAIVCDVEVNAENAGTRTVTMVGLPQAAVKESVERVFQAIDNCSYPAIPRKVLINLAPADVKKEAAALDLPLAIGLLRAAKFITTESHKHYLIAGELALDGRIRKIKGALSLAMLAKSKGLTGVIVPHENAREAAVVEGIDVIACSTLPQAVSFLNGQLELEPFQLEGESYAQSQVEQPLDFVDVRGQEAVKRAITIACAGGHNLAMIGPPGTGKTMLAQRMPGILPPLSREESLETTRIYSALGLLPDGVALMDRRPVRSPHHSATAQALIGGGSNPRPGEVSMAHNGILFLDELPEFSRQVLEMLRQPLESGDVFISRAVGSFRFPARFMLVAAMNPTQGGKDSADPRLREKYLSRLSGPLLDRIDMHVEVPSVPYHELVGKKPGTNSATMKGQVDRARAMQLERFKTGRANAQMDSRLLKEHAELSDACLMLMKQAVDELGLSARAYDKVRRVARTIADIEGAATISESHLAEAIQYRLLDRKY